MVAAGVPFLLCFSAGQIGGIGGGVVFALLLAAFAFLAFVIFATGAPFNQGWWSLLPLVGGVAGFCVGAALPNSLVS
jgi:hypothetical protein